MNDIDVATVIIRIEQINREQEPEHWLWDRVMTCDIPRLRAQLPEELIEMINELTP